jgi:hypothetical protein
MHDGDYPASHSRFPSLCSTLGYLYLPSFVGGLRGPGGPSGPNGEVVDQKGIEEASNYRGGDEDVEKKTQKMRSRSSTTFKGLPSRPKQGGSKHWRFLMRRIARKLPFFLTHLLTVALRCWRDPGLPGFDLEESSGHPLFSVGQWTCSYVELCTYQHPNPHPTPLPQRSLARFATIVMHT